MSSSPEPNPTVERFSGFADIYDAYRPAPPAIFTDVLIQLSQTERPALVVDLGCGTGLSTRIWADRAERIIGIDPSQDMRQEAQAQTKASNTEYRAGFANDTGLPAGCADIVTCSSSVHWMDPVSTYPEIARILRKGGVFAAFGYDWPPTMGTWEIDLAQAEFHASCKELESRYGISKDVKQWPKEEVPDRMRESGRFRFIKRIHLHQTLQWDADSYIGWILSQGSVESLIKARLPEMETNLEKLKTAAKQLLGHTPQPVYFSYWVAIGIV